MPTTINKKRHATIVELHDWHAFAQDDAGFRYFIFHNAVATTGQWCFDDLRQGSVVAMTVIEHPKGLRGIEVDIIQR